MARCFVNEETYITSYINLVSYRCINSPVLMKLLHSHVLMDAHAHNFVHLSPSHPESWRVTLIVPDSGMKRDTDEAQGSRSSFPTLSSRRGGVFIYFRLRPDVAGVTQPFFIRSNLLM